MNLTEERCRIFQFLPTACQKYYLFSYFSNLQFTIVCILLYFYK
jgi:hypothetical protein